jgi:hypothetical protein
LAESDGTRTNGGCLKMKNPRTPGDGITRASETLGGDHSEPFVAHAGPRFNDGHPRTAAALDRAADWLLVLGRHRAAERLSRMAFELRTTEAAA